MKNDRSPCLDVCSTATLVAFSLGNTSSQAEEGYASPASTAGRNVRLVVTVLVQLQLHDCNVAVQCAG